jgi:hypothetical protein
LQKDLRAGKALRHEPCFPILFNFTVLYHFPSPSSWQEFEALCHILWRDIWCDHNAQRNGRNGQAQSGVDIFGYPPYAKGYHGVQCKGKDSVLGATITTSEIIEERNKAATFLPRLEHFTIATTSPRDAGLQEFVRTLSHSEQDEIFRVTLWSWHDISEELSYRRDLIQQIYGETPFGFNTEPEQSKIRRKDPIDKLFAILSRP